MTGLSLSFVHHRFSYSKLMTSYRSSFRYTILENACKNFQGILFSLIQKIIPSHVRVEMSLHVNMSQFLGSFFTKSVQLDWNGLLASQLTYHTIHLIQCGSHYLSSTNINDLAIIEWQPEKVIGYTCCYLTSHEDRPNQHDTSSQYHTNTFDTLTC